jgi:hypothetical protein
VTDAAAEQAALSDLSLRRRAGPGAFERGVTYARSGAVTVDESASTPQRIVATVAGTTAYLTSIEFDEAGLRSDCSCPAGGFCKHLVALALVWRARREGRLIATDGTAAKKVAASAKRAQTQRDNRVALDAFLRMQSVDALADRLMALAEEDPQTLRMLRAWHAANAATKGGDVKQQVRALLTPSSRFLDRRAAGAFLSGAMQVLSVLAAQREADPEKGLELAAFALKRTFALQGRIDDSDGEITTLASAIGEEWLRSLQAAGERPATFADQWFKLWREDGHGWTDATEAERRMGKAARQRYLKLVAAESQRTADVVIQHLRTAPAKSAGRHGGGIRPAVDRAPWDLLWAARRARVEHLRLLEVQGDLDGMLDVLRSPPSDERDASARVGLLDGAGRVREAIREAESALRIHPASECIENALLLILERDGWTDEALRLRVARLERLLSPSRYTALLQAASAAKADVEAIRNGVMRRVTAAEDEALSRGGPDARRDVSMRVALLSAEQRWDEAYALADTGGVCDAQLLETLALRLPPAQWSLACRFLERVIRTHLPHAQNPYTTALDLASEIAMRMPAEKRGAWLDALRREFRQKRRFVEGLARIENGEGST